MNEGKGKTKEEINGDVIESDSDLWCEVIYKRRGYRRSS